MEPDHLLICVEPVLHLAILFVAIHILHRSAQRPVQFLVLLRGNVQNLRGQFYKGILPVVQSQYFLPNVESDGCKQGNHLFFVCK